MQHYTPGNSRKREGVYLAYMRAHLLIILHSFIKLLYILLMRSIVCFDIVLVMKVLEASSGLPVSECKAAKPEV